MFQMRLQPSSVALKYIILIVCQLKWAWDYFLLQSSFQACEIFEVPDYVDDLTVKFFENNNNLERGDSSLECAVCLCGIDEGDEVRELGCNHLYHRVCLDKWVGYGHRTCPLCREKLKPPALQLAGRLASTSMPRLYCLTSAPPDQGTMDVPAACANYK